MNSESKKLDLYFCSKYLVRLHSAKASFVLGTYTGLRKLPFGMELAEP